MPHSGESGLQAMPIEIFHLAGSQNKILSAFTEAVKVTVLQKIDHK
jgi:hypothetical protein